MLNISLFSGLILINKIISYNETTGTIVKEITFITDSSFIYSLPLGV